MATKSYRQAAILELIDRERVPSQEALGRRLASMGLAATQATISRDIKQLGLVKSSADGAYQRPGVAPIVAGVGEDGLRRVVATCLRRADQVQQFVVLKTAPGEAQMLAIALDRAGEAGVVGTVAGDDTILVITRDVRRARALAERFEAWARREPSTREPARRRA